MDIFLIHNFFFYRGFIIKELLINNQIVAESVRLVGETGEQLGIMSLSEALSVAEQSGLDLAQISPNINPVVCKLMDYGKYKFDQQKREKEARKKQKVTEIKTIQLSLTIGEHDMSYRAKQAMEFVKEGNKVKVSILLKGRQQAFASQGFEIMKKFASLVSEVAMIEKDPSQEGKFINMILNQKK